MKTRRTAIRRRDVLTGIGAGLAVSALSTRASAQTVGADGKKEAIAILGTGRLGSVLGKLWAAAGHPIHFGSRTPTEDRVKALVGACGPASSASRPQDAAARADVVVFALPWKGAKELLPALGDLTGKVIIDPMNALKMVARYPEAAPDVATSVAEELQAALRGAYVVKALNTPAAKNIVEPKRVGTPITIALAGADVAAKARVAGLVAELGLQPLDTGPLIAARYLEAMMRFSVGYLLYSGKSFEFYLSPVTTA